MSDDRDTYDAPAHGWTCFHCGDTFMTPVAARDHFGETPDRKPACLLKLAGGDRGLVKALRRAEARIAELEALINSPHTADFLESVKLEAAHQVDRWGTAHDRAKQPADWFWLLGYLAGKALAAAQAGDREKALHHTISSAAALANWHAAISGSDNRMQPGSSDVQQIVEAAFGPEAGS